MMKGYDVRRRCGYVMKGYDVRRCGYVMKGYDVRRCGYVMRRCDAREVWLGDGHRGVY